MVNTNILIDIQLIINIQDICNKVIADMKKEDENLLLRKKKEILIYEH